MRRDVLLPFALAGLLAVLFTGMPSQSSEPENPKPDLAKIHGRIQFVKSFPGPAR